MSPNAIVESEGLTGHIGCTRLADACHIIALRSEPDVAAVEIRLAARAPWTRGAHVLGIVHIASRLVLHVSLCAWNLTLVVSHACLALPI